jgi:hypothetical protein
MYKNKIKLAHIPTGGFKGGPHPFLTKNLKTKLVKLWIWHSEWVKYFTSTYAHPLLSDIQDPPLGSSSLDCPGLPLLLLLSVSTLLLYQYFIFHHRVLHICFVFRFIIEIGY